MSLIYDAKTAKEAADIRNSYHGWTWYFLKKIREAADDGKYSVSKDIGRGGSFSEKDALENMDLFIKALSETMP